MSRKNHRQRKTVPAAWFFLWGLSSFDRLLQPIPGIQHFRISGMDLKNIVDPAQQLHPVGFPVCLQTGFLQVFPDAELLAVVQLLPQLTAVTCRNAQLFVDNDACDRLLLTGTLYL